MGDELRKILIEDVKEQDLTDMLLAFERLLDLPFAYKAKDFIYLYRKPVGNVGDSTTNIIQPEYDVEGRGFVECAGQKICCRKGESHQARLRTDNHSPCRLYGY